MVRSPERLPWPPNLDDLETSGCFRSSRYLSSFGVSRYIACIVERCSSLCVLELPLLDHEGLVCCRWAEIERLEAGGKL